MARVIPAEGDPLPAEMCGLYLGTESVFGRLPVIRRVLTTWRRTLGLSWPIATEQTFTTLMRTVDLIVTGLISPVAIVAVGLADRFATIPLRIGLGLGSGTIALTSQDTSSGHLENRDEVLTQAMVLGFLLGLPIVVLGFLIGDWAIAALGASEDAVTLGGLYLSIILLGAPSRHMGLTAVRAIQGSGNTMTPMYVNVAANLLNVVLTVVLALGVGPVPAYGVVGVGVATAVARTFQGGTLILYILSARSTLSFVRPQQWTITRQLVALAVPHTAEGFTRTAADFPFNAILLALGTEFNAAYQVGRRIYQQLSSPLSRAMRTGASIVVGQHVGHRDTDAAIFDGYAIAAFGLVVVGAMSCILFVAAEPLVGIFTRDVETVTYAVDFVRVFAIIGIFHVVFQALSGALRGGSDTRTPFYANLSGTFLLLVGGSYVLALALDYGPIGVYVAMVVSYAYLTAFVSVQFYRGIWIERSYAYMDERREHDMIEQ